jgi:hypothetical protein
VLDGSWVASRAGGDSVAIIQTTGGRIIDMVVGVPSQAAME